jgi:hypothetical protein
VQISDIIRGDKSAIQISDWKTGHITRTAFPLSRVKSRRYKLGSEYRWRTIQFTALGREFRVLIELNENKAIYRATLGLKNEEDITVICQHEYHNSEPGWHCHVSFGEVEKLPSGVMRSSLTRWPKALLVQPEAVFPVSQNNALSVAAERFRFRAQGDLL